MRGQTQTGLAPAAQPKWRQTYQVESRGGRHLGGGGAGTGVTASTTGSGPGNAHGTGGASALMGATGTSPGRAAPWRVRLRVPESAADKAPSPSILRSRRRPTFGAGAALSGVEGDTTAGVALPTVAPDNATGDALPGVTSGRGAGMTPPGVTPPPRLPDRDASSSTPLPSAFFSLQRPLRCPAAAGAPPLVGGDEAAGGGSAGGGVPVVGDVPVVGLVRVGGGVRVVGGGVRAAPYAAALARVPDEEVPARMPLLPSAMRSLLMRTRGAVAGAATKDAGTPREGAGVSVSIGVGAAAAGSSPAPDPPAGRPPPDRTGTGGSVAARWLQYTPSSSTSSTTSSSSGGPAPIARRPPAPRSAGPPAPMAVEQSGRCGATARPGERHAAAGTRRGHDGARPSPGSATASRRASSSSQGRRK